MEIIASEVGLASQHLSRQQHHQQESLRAWSGGADQPPVAADRLSLSAAALVEHRRARAAEEPALEGATTNDPKLEAIRRILETLTGREIEVARFAEQQPAAVPAPTTAAATPEGPSPVGWGIEYSRREIFREEEATTFVAQGRVMTAAGGSLDFRIELVMERHFAAESSLQLAAGDARLTDPLVVNFAAPAASLDDSALFAFDLTADGAPEEIPFLRAGSGFLVLDRNGDGAVNDGGELFGPTSGDGFSELARYDSDGNGWLDESDPIFEKLAVWARTVAGSDSLASLADLGIGALLLDSAASRFSLADDTNALLGQVRETSLFIRENGSVGTLQEIDLVA